MAIEGLGKQEVRILFHGLIACTILEATSSYDSGTDVQGTFHGINKTYTDWLCSLCGARMKEARGLLDDKYWDYRAWGRST